MATVMNSLMIPEPSFREQVPGAFQMLNCSFSLSLWLWGKCNKRAVLITIQKASIHNPLSLHPTNALLFAFFFWAIARVKLYWLSDITVFFSLESNIFPSIFLSVLSITHGWRFLFPINSYWITVDGGISHTIVKEIVEHVHYYHDQLHHIANHFHIFAKKIIWICPCSHQESSSEICCCCFVFISMLQINTTNVGFSGRNFPITLSHSIIFVLDFERYCTWIKVSGL